MGYSKITSVIFDVDGVLTDGTFFYSVEGKILKRFGSHDAPAIKKCKSIFNLQLISADEKGFEISKLRADHLGLPIRSKSLKITFSSDSTSSDEEYTCSSVPISYKISEVFIVSQKLINS